MGTNRNHEKWLAKVAEDPIDASVPIIDAHHHLWLGYDAVVPWQPDYLHNEFASDLDSGHNIVATVYVECGFSYKQDAPDNFRPIGETERITRFAQEFRSKTGSATKVCAAISAHANLATGSQIESVLAAHKEASAGRVKGIRQIANWDPDEAVRYPGVSIPQGLLLSDKFHQGYATLGRHDLLFEAWLFHPQIPELAPLAAKFPDTRLVINHFGGPVGIGQYSGQADAVFSQWRNDITKLASYPNTYMKLGGIGMEHSGFGWHHRECPPTSDEIVEATQRYYHHAIEIFGPERCMFESNAPVDKISYSYSVLWNAFKKIAARYSSSEQREMFFGTAKQVYDLDV